MQYVVLGYAAPCEMFVREMRKTLSSTGQSPIKGLRDPIYVALTAFTIMFPGRDDGAVVTRLGT